LVLLHSDLPGTDDLATDTGFHQIEALLEVIDVDLMGQHFL
jgi:hypothetical protein